MSVLTTQLSEGVAAELRQYADREGVTVDQLLSAATAEKMFGLR